MPRTVEISVFRYEELSDKVKEQVRNRWLEFFDFRWYSRDIIEEFVASLAFIGFDVERKDVSYAIDSSSDGASFTGSWAPGRRKAIPTDEGWRIGQLGAREVEYFQGITLTEEQADASVSIVRNGSHYCNERSVSFDFNAGFPQDQDDVFEQRTRTLMLQLHMFLAEDYAFRISEEQMVAEFTAEDTEFYADGRRFT